MPPCERGQVCTGAHNHPASMAHNHPATLKQEHTISRPRCNGGTQLPGHGGTQSQPLLHGGTQSPGARSRARVCSYAYTNARKREPGHIHTFTRPRSTRARVFVRLHKRTSLTTFARMYEHANVTTHRLITMYSLGQSGLAAFSGLHEYRPRSSTSCPAHLIPY